MKTPSFSGSPAAVGRAKKARWWDDWIRFHTAWRASGETPPDLGRVAAFRTLLEEIAPAWLEEADAFAGEDVNSYLDFQCRRPQPTAGSLAEANCSTLLAPGARETFLLKIRDESPHPQVMWRQHVNGTHAFLAGSNMGNLGAAHVANASGLVGANNTGGPLQDESTAVGLNDCLILRLIAEQCTTCMEAMVLLEKLAADGFLGNGGYARGMIFLFADATGEGGVAECSRHKVCARTFREDVHISTNHFVLSELKEEIHSEQLEEPVMRSSLERWRRMTALARESQPLNISRLMQISRDAEGEFPLCQAHPVFPWRTVSAWIHQIQPHQENPVTTYACNVAPTLGAYEKLTPL